MKQNHKSGGFTLLELLVVIGIIAILVTTAMVSYSSTQAKARNSRRRADITAMRDALEQYRSAGTDYPNVCSGAGSYIKGSWPVDPGTTTSYTDGDGASCTAAGYCICATMEGGVGGNSSANNASCNSWVNNGPYFCVANLQ